MNWYALSQLEPVARLIVYKELLRKHTEKDRSWALRQSRPCASVYKWHNRNSPTRVRNRQILIQRIEALEKRIPRKVS